MNCSQYRGEGRGLLHRPSICRSKKGFLAQRLCFLPLYPASIVRCKLRTPRLRDLKRKPAVCIEHHNAFWIRTKRLEPATIGTDVVCSDDEPTSNKLLLKRFFLRNCVSRQEHKSKCSHCENTENDTSIHGLSSGIVAYSIIRSSVASVWRCRSAITQLRYW